MGLFSTIGGFFTEKALPKVVSAELPIGQNFLRDVGYIAESVVSKVVGTTSRVATTIGNSFVKNPVGTSITAISVPLFTGAVLRRPGPVLTATAKAPGRLADIGGDLADLTNKPSAGGFLDFVKEHPIFSGATAIIAGTAAVKTTQAIKNLGKTNTNVTINDEGGNSGNNPISQFVPSSAITQNFFVTQPPTSTLIEPVVAPLSDATITKTKVKKKKKKVTKKKRRKVYKKVKHRRKKYGKHKRARKLHRK